MRTRTLTWIGFARRSSVSRFVALAASAIVVPAALSQTTPGTTTTAPAITPGKLPPVDSGAAKVPEAVIKPADTPLAKAGWLRITGNTVNVRARPDVNSLSMTRLERDSVVSAVKKENGWWAISPPPDVFSLIAAEFVERTGTDRGIVKVESGSTLRVRAGSCNVQVNPQETDVQTKLGNGDEVRIVGEVTSGTKPNGQPERWFQIAPPAGVAAYISAEFAEEISADAARAREATQPGTTIVATPATAEPGASNPDRSGVKLAQDAEETSRSAGASTSVPSAGAGSSGTITTTTIIPVTTGAGDTIGGANTSGTPAVGPTTTIIPVTPGAGDTTGGASTSGTPAVGTTTNTIPMERSRAEGSENPAFDVEGILQPSWRIPAGQFGLRYKLCNPTNPNLVRGYAEFPFEMSISPTKYIGKYVGVIGDRYMDMDHEVPIYRAKRLTILSPDRPVNRPRDQQ